MEPIDFLWRGAAAHPDRPALVGVERTLTWAELAARVAALGAGVAALAPDPDARVGVCGWNTESHLLGLLAVLAAGRAWVPLNPRDSIEDLDAKLAAARPALAIVDADCLGACGWRDTALLLGAGAGAGDHSLARLARDHAGAAPRHAPRPRETTQAIKFTGGSSGRPKGVRQPIRAWMAGAVSMVHGLGLDGRDRFLAAAPITHATSTFLTPMLAAGGTLLLPPEPKPTPGLLLDACADLAPTVTFLPPTAIYMLLAAAEARGVAPRFPAMRHLVYGGAPMPPEKVAACLDALGPVLATQYGQTEAPQTIAMITAADLAQPRWHGSVGPAGLLTRLAIRGRDGQPAAPGEDGEIMVAGDLVMTGYLDMPDATAEVLRDGWLMTGDVGMLDERGYLFIRDRLRDVVITGGFNVYPSDVEAALMRHPLVHEAVVFGVADDKWGEAVHAAVQPRAGGTVEVAALIAFAKDKLGSVKAPKVIHVVDDLPRSPVGKVLRREVRRRFANT
jgi:acyl-CoA synthetase (AMP-forming)/AMP-acid ligase II